MVDLMQNLKRHRLNGLCLFLPIALLLSTSTEAAPRRFNYDEESTTAIREMRDSLEALRHEVENHETEIRMAEERSNNQEATIASLRQQVLDANQLNKDLVKGNTSSLDERISTIEASNKGLIADLQKFKTHANDSSTALGQYKERIAELEKAIAMQNQNMDSLQTAIRSLTEALQVQTKEIALADTRHPTHPTPSDKKTYQVKPGDTLEKIAKNNHTTIKALKEANSLSSDRIVVGQNLIIPN